MCNDCNEHDDSYFPDPPGLDCCGNIAPEPPRVVKPCADCDDPSVLPTGLVTTEKDGNPCDDCFPNHPEPPVVVPPIVDPQPVVYFSSPRSRVSTRNNCPVGMIGSIVTTNLQAGAFQSIFSQADADKKAEQWLDAIVQIKANQSGTCSDDPSDNTVLSELSWMGDADCPSVTTLNLLEWGSASGELDLCS